MRFPGSFRQCASLPVAGLTDSPFFCVDLFQDLDLHRLVGYYTLEPRVFIFQRPQPASLIDLHSPLLTLPPVVGLVADVMFGARLPDRRRLRFLQYPDDLLFTESTSLHWFCF